MRTGKSRIKNPRERNGSAQEESDAFVLPIHAPKNGLSALTRKLSATIFFAVFLDLTVLLSGQIPSAWQSRGVGAGGALYAPSINPVNDREYYVASDMSELYHTTDFGNSYSIVNFQQVQGGHESAVRFTSNPLVAYSITYTGGNNALPCKTTDGGATWTVLPGNPLPYDDTYSIWADYNNPTAWSSQAIRRSISPLTAVAASRP